MSGAARCACLLGESCAIPRRASLGVPLGEPARAGPARLEVRCFGRFHAERLVLRLQVLEAICMRPSNTPIQPVNELG